MNEPQVNFVPEDRLGSELGSVDNLKPNSPAAPTSTSNVVSSGNGSILNGGTFQNPIYVPEVSGWKLDSNGDAEFQNIKARGEITADSLNIGGITEITVTTSDNLQTALNTINTNGGGILRLSPGTYTITADLTVYDNTQIIGNSSNNTVLDFNSGAYSLIWLGTDVYTTGTIASIGSGVNVVGSSTTWTSAMVGRQIFIDNRWYVIAAFTDTTHITLATAYADGATFAGNYRISNVINNVAIKGVTIKNSTTTALEGTDIREVQLEDVVFLSNNKGFVFTNFMSVVFNSVTVAASTSNGYELTNGSFFNGYSVASVSNGGHGVVLNTIKSSGWILSASNSNTTDGVNMTSVTNCLVLVEASGNGSNGIECVSGCNNNFFHSGIINGNTSDGIKLTATSDNNTIGPSLNITNNGGYGINIAASTCDGNIILSPVFSGNSSGEYLDNGTSTRNSFHEKSTASDTLLVSADTEETQNGDTYTKKKDIFLPFGGTIRVKFDLKTDDNGRAAFGRVYINNIAVGTERSTLSLTYVEYSEDFSVSAGSSIQLYIHDTAGGSALAYCQNFRIYCDRVSVTNYLIVDS